MLRIVLWLLWTVVSVVLAVGFWQAWGAAARNSASPGAIVLPLLAAAFLLSSIGAFVRLVQAWQKWTRARAGPSH
jgi:TRAP-type C4-dicarboxylate transport system permease small subunit